MFDDVPNAKSQVSFEVVMSTLRTIGRATVELFASDAAITKGTLKRLIRLFQRVDGTEPIRADWVLNGSTELEILLDHASESFGLSSQKLIALVQFIAMEASPKELLLALAKWSAVAPKLNSELYEVLRTILRRGARECHSGAELSQSLRHVREASVGLRAKESKQDDAPVTVNHAESGIWHKISLGALYLAK